MKTLRSYLGGQWHEATTGFVPLVDPATEEEIARVSSAGARFDEALDMARRQGGPELRAMTFAQRSGLLKAMAKTLREHRDELLDLSRLNNGTTAADGAFDVDGASGTLAFYAGVGRTVGDRVSLVEGEDLPLSRDGGFRGRHLWLPRRGVAVHINAFNFPAWGFAEKAACALLAGMPVITKPATATALVAHRCVEILLDAAILPAGALQLVCGSTGKLLDGLGSQDVVAFTGSAKTARVLNERLLQRGVSARLNVEADSLNAAVLAPDTQEKSVTRELFLRDVLREITQKAGQKCTAVRRILVPATVIDEVQEALIAQLASVVTGNPAEASVTMGPLASAQQLDSAEQGVAALAAAADLVFGTGRRADGPGSPPGRGYFFPPTLLRVGDGQAAEVVHEREVFAPVATLIPYDGGAATAAEIVALAGGTLVTSVYSDDPEWVAQLLAGAGATTGRLYVGSEETAAETPGSGVALPQTLHGGPGRAGGGEELGGLIGVQRYLQRLAVQGGVGLLTSLEAAPVASG